MVWVIMRSRSGALNVNDDGRLRANNFNDNDNPNNWAFGGVSSAELLSPFFLALFLHFYLALKITFLLT